MKKEVKLVRDEDKHPIDSYLVDNEGNHVSYSGICNEEARQIHKKVDDDLRLMCMVIFWASVLLFIHIGTVFVVPMLFVLAAYISNMVIDKHVQKLYSRMSECEYYEDTVYLFNRDWNMYRWFNKAIWACFAIGVLSFVALLLA